MFRQGASIISRRGMTTRSMPATGFLAPKQLANKPFCPVPDDRVSNFLARRNPEPGRPDLVGEGEAGHEPAPIARAMVVDAGKLRPAA